MKNVLMLGVIVGCLLGFVLTASSEDITIVGTGDGTAILQAVGEAFHRLNPEVTITVPPSIGTEGGIKAVGRDENVLGRVARAIKESEKPYGLTYIPYAKVPTVFFVNPSVRVADLSTQQILDIYRGATTNWQEVGGSDTKIKVITREKGDSSLAILRKFFPGFNDLTITPKSKTTLSTPKTESTVVNIADTIAYGPYNVNLIDVKVLKINGQRVTDPTIRIL